MTDVAPKTTTVFFGRKQGLPNYSNVEAGIHVQFDGDPLTDGEWEEKVAKSFELAKATVLNQLDIPFEITEGKVVETAAPAPSTAAPKNAAPQRNGSYPAKKKEPFPNDNGPSAGRRVLGEWNDIEISVVNGKFGPYLTGDGIKNLTLKNWMKKSDDPFKDVTLKLAAEFLEKRESYSDNDGGGY